MKSLRLLIVSITALATAAACGVASSTNESGDARFVADAEAVAEGGAAEGDRAVEAVADATADGGGNAAAVDAATLDASTNTSADAGIDAAPGYFTSVTEPERLSVPLKKGESTYTYRSALFQDLNGDGVGDIVISIGTYPNNTSQPIVIFDGAAGTLANAAPTMFTGGMVTSVRHSNQIFTADFNNDGLQDLLISEAGLDHDPWTGDKIGIAINNGNGTYTDISNNVPANAQGLRAYSMAAGRFFNDGITRVVVPSATDPSHTVLLSWQSNAFVVQPNWVDGAIWGFPGNMAYASYLEARDIDGDGYVDLYGGGNWTTPNNRVLWGSANFPAVENLATLPEGHTGHTPWADYDKPGVSTAQGGDVNRVVFADFDGDGKTDIVSITEQANIYKPGAFTDTKYPDYAAIHANGGTAYYNGWLQVLKGDGARTFTDITAAMGTGDLGMKYYVALFTRDLDLDGDLDLVGHYWAKFYNGALVAPRWGTTIFLNDGKAAFRAIDARAFAPQLESVSLGTSFNGLGAMFPITITPTQIDGIFFTPIDANPANPTLLARRFRAVGQFH